MRALLPAVAILAACGTTGPSDPQFYFVAKGQFCQARALVEAAVFVGEIPVSDTIVRYFRASGVLCPDFAAEVAAAVEADVTEAEARAAAADVLPVEAL